jgi:RHS repeat-associated protein
MRKNILLDTVSWIRKLFLWGSIVMIIAKRVHLNITIVLICAIMLMGLPFSALARHYGQWDIYHKVTDVDPGDKDDKPCDPPCNGCDSTASPVFLKDGNYFQKWTDLQIPSKGFDFKVERIYHSRDMHYAYLGHGWTLNYEIRLIFVTDEANNYAIIRMPNGQRYRFQQNSDGSYNSPKGIFQKLMKNSDGTYTLNKKFGDVYEFNADGNMTTISDKNGNQISFIYDNFGCINSVSDANGKSLTFIKGANGKISSIIDFSGRKIDYKYDNNGDLISVTDPEGHIVSYLYDSSHNLTAIVDSVGNVIRRISYDSEKRVLNYTDGEETYTYTYVSDTITQVKDSQNNSWRYTFDQYGLLTQVAGPLGYTTAKSYDADFNLISATDANGNKTLYDYDNRGNLVTITDPNGKKTYFTYEPNFEQLETLKNPLGIVTKYEYDNKGNPIKIYKAYGTVNQITTALSYDSAGNKISETSPLGNTTLYIYDENSNLLSETNPMGKTFSQTYDNQGNVISKTDPLGNTTHYIYDKNNNLITETDPAGNVKSLIYGPLGKLISETDANKNTISFDYDVYDRISKITDANGKSEFRYYDKKGNISSFINRNGDVIFFKYDNLGRLSKKIIKVGDKSDNIDSNDVVNEYYYDLAGNLIETKDPNKKTATLAYDQLDRRISLVTPSGELLAYNYDDDGKLIFRQMGKGISQQFNYDELNRLVKVYDKQGVTKEYLYDADGNTKTVKDADGNTMSFVYNQLGKVSERIYPDGKSDKIEYNELGKIKSIIDRNGRAVTFTYDNLNRIISSVNNTGKTIHAKYDAVGNLISITDQNGNTTRYENDSSNRLISEIYADNKSTKMEYDDIGRLMSKTDLNGNIIYFAYNEQNLLIKRDVPGDNDDLFTYNTNGSLLQAKNNNAAVDFVYDNDGRLIQEKINLNGSTVTKIIDYKYDFQNLTKKITYPGGRVVVQNFDDRERMNSISDEAGNIIANFQYNLNNQRTSLRLVNGISTTYNYNDLGLITNAEHKDAANSLLNLQYNYAGNGRISLVFNQTNPVDSEKFEYDAVDRLVEFKRGNLSGNDINNPIKQIEYDLDALGNWLSMTTDGSAESRSVNQVNQYTQVGNNQFAYDNNGNLLDDGNKVYSYNAMKQLIGVRKKTDSSIIAEYAYDAMGRKISKLSSGGIINYFYDQKVQLIEEQLNDTTLATYIYGPRQNELVSLKRNGQTYYAHADIMGSIRLITDQSGSIIERYKYDPYGMPFISDANGNQINTSAIGNSLLFTGQQYDQDAGIYYYRARYYDPSLGRFLNQDPIGYVDGFNLYEYAKSDPINWKDPWGTESCKFTSTFELDLEGPVQKLFGEVVKAFGLKWDIGGSIALKAESCSEKCCPPGGSEYIDVYYDKWSLEADLNMSFGGPIPYLSFTVPIVGTFGVHGELAFGVTGNGTLSEKINENDCSVSCDDKLCLSPYGSLNLFVGAKLAQQDDDDKDFKDIDDPFGGKVGFDFEGSISGEVCYGCDGWSWDACISGSLELSAEIEIVWISWGWGLEIWSGEVCANK